MGHEVLIESWFKKNTWLSLDYIIVLREFFRLLPILWKEIESNMKLICYTDLFILTKSFLFLLRHEMEPIKQLMEKEDTLEFVSDERTSFTMVGSLFVFSAVWTFGVCVDTNSRKKFDVILKRALMSEISMTNKKRKLVIPEKNTFYDFQFIIHCK